MLTCLVNEDLVQRRLAHLQVLPAADLEEEPASEPVADLEEEPASEPVAELAPEQVSEPAPEPDTIAAARPDDEPAPETDTTSAAETDEEIATELDSEPVEEPRYDPMPELQTALDTIMAADIDQLLEEAISIEESEEETDSELLDAADAVEQSDAAEATAPDDAESISEPTLEEEQPEVLVDAFGQPILSPTPEAEAELTAADAEPVDQPSPPMVDQAPQRESEREADFEAEEEGEREFELELRKGKNQRRKDRQKRRQLVLDEQSGEVIAKRRRKGGRGSWDEEEWEDYDF